jgi:hypothetical protein
MSEIKNQPNPLAGAAIHRIRPGQEVAALETAKKNGADDLFFTVGKDTFVATGRGLPLKGVKPGDAITHEGRQGIVTAIDNQVNTAKEGALAVLKPSGLAAGGATAAGTLVGKGLGGFFGASGAGAAVGAITVGVYAGIAAGLAVGGGALYGAKRGIDTESIKAHAE